MKHFIIFSPSIGSYQSSGWAEYRGSAEREALGDIAHTHAINPRKSAFLGLAALAGCQNNRQ